MNGSLPLALCLTAALLLSGCQGNPAAQSAEDTPVEESLGTYYEEAMEQAEAPDDPVLAVYKDQTVLRSVVDYQKQTQAALAGVDPATLSDREVVDDLLKNALLLEEAEARGLTPTQEEIEQYLQETVYTAYELPEGKEQIDNYCASAGISFEEYVADLRGQAPRFLAKAKLKEAVMEEYCQAHSQPFIQEEQIPGRRPPWDLSFFLNSLALFLFLWYIDLTKGPLLTKGGTSHETTQIPMDPGLASCRYLGLS